MSGAIAPGQNIMALGLSLLINRVLSADRQLVIVDSTDPSAASLDVLYRELFLVRTDGRVLWQISFDDQDQKRFSPIGPAGWSFVGLVDRLARTYAQRFDGALFDVDLNTGWASYVTWTK